MKQAAESSSLDVLGAQEYSTTARGLAALDAMVKAAPVRILSVHTITPGKYVILLTGDVASVESSLKAGRSAAGDDVLDELFIPNLHSDIIPALKYQQECKEWDAIGIIETGTVMAGIAAADTAAKRSAVKIAYVRMDSHMGGRSSVKLTGPLSEVESAVEAGAREAEKRGSFLRTVVIPRPHPDIAPFVQE